MGPFIDTGITYDVLPNGGTPPGESTANPAWNMSTASDAYAYEFDFSHIAALNDQAAIFLRLVNLSTISASGGTISTNGTSRLDNFMIHYHSMPELGLPGDFNSDGVVNAADYVVWRKTNNGDLTAYNQWHANFGRTAAGSGGQSSNVPEPATIGTASTRHLFARHPPQ